MATLEAAMSTQPPEPIRPLSMDTTWVRCGNCKKQYEVPTGQPYRYLAVQAHKSRCPKGNPSQVQAQHALLVKEFAEQQAAARRRPARRWFEFWRWFE
jgi:hypothetical protein